MPFKLSSMICRAIVFHVCAQYKCGEVKSPPLRSQRRALVLILGPKAIFGFDTGDKSAPGFDTGDKGFPGFDTADKSAANRTAGGGLFTRC